MSDQQPSIEPETNMRWREIVIRAWSDDEFKRRLISDPRATLADAGLPVSEDVNYVVIENEPRRIHLILPSRPDVDISISHMTDGDYDPGF